jgi:hypothetical protein
VKGTAREPPRQVEVPRSWASLRSASSSAGALVSFLLKLEIRCGKTASTDGGLMSDDKLGNKQSGGIVIPALMWWAGVPLVAVIILWALFFRG